MTHKYQVLLIGSFSADRVLLETSLFKQIDDLGLSRNQVVVIEEKDFGQIDPKSPLVALFFGYNGANDKEHPCLVELARDSIPTIPCVSEVSAVKKTLPESLYHINVFPLGNPKIEWQRLVTLILENLRLLRSERRLFISYRRMEAQNVAIQLYEALDRSGFDVFLDTRSVPFAVDFQGILWHRMADSDVVILLDTPDFRNSFWTREELTQANATNIQILHILWPDVKPDNGSAFSEFVTLSGSDFKTLKQVGTEARFSDDAVIRTVIRTESLRARALAARHRSLVDNFCDQARYHKVKSVAVQPERFISVELSAGERVAVVPTIGVPRADLYQEIEFAIRSSGHITDQIWLLYDERGLLEKWLSHLDWLNDHLPITALQVSRCSQRLTGGGK